jgi:hypothetical protein
MDSVAMGPDGQANHLLGLMRSQRNSGSLKSYTEFLPGLFLNSDPALELRGKIKSPADQLLELTLKPHGNGNWTGLHLALGLMRPDNLGISTKSLYIWMAQFSKSQSQTDQEVEVRRLKKELARVTEERDILKKANAYFARDAK